MRDGLQPGLPTVETELLPNTEYEVRATIWNNSYEAPVVGKGDCWVYDSLHDGWNEIHAIHACQRIGEFDPAADWPPEMSTTAGVQQLVDEWCRSIAEAEEAEEDGSREDPVNQWEVHPLIDGCKPPVIIE